MDFALQRLQPLDVLRLLRQERIEHRLVLAGGVEPPLDADLLDQLVEAERRADHADRADDRGGIGDDLVGRAGDHVAAGGGDVLDERQHRKLLLVGECADAAMDQMRLRRGASRRIDRQRDRPDIRASKTPVRANAPHWQASGRASAGWISRWRRTSRTTGTTGMSVRNRAGTSARSAAGTFSNMEGSAISPADMRRVPKPQVMPS